MQKEGRRGRQRETGKEGYKEGENSRRRKIEMEAERGRERAAPLFPQPVITSCMFKQALVKYPEEDPGSQAQR